MTYDREELRLEYLAERRGKPWTDGQVSEHYGTSPQWIRDQIKKAEALDVVTVGGIDFTPDHPNYQEAVDTKLAMDASMIRPPIWALRVMVFVIAAVALSVLYYFFGGAS